MKAAPALAAVILGLAMLLLTGAGSAPSDLPQFTSTGRLLRPQNYREWIFLSSGLGMTYGPLASPAEPRFDNVFVNPSAYRTFLATGRWPTGTVLVLEVRSAQSNGSINRGGHFQSDLIGIETHVKDEKRFPRKWAFFGFREGQPVSEAPASETSSCYSRHEPNGAVDTTFVQFYPTLIPVAKQKGTLKVIP
jgi:Cytochrome P460